MDNKSARLRRAKKLRIKLKELDKVRLCIHRTPRHIYAQVISGNGAEVLASAATVEASVKEECKYTGNVDAAKAVGKLIAQRAAEKGINSVAFDRAGFKYHGRVKALAESARENGLKF